MKLNELIRENILRLKPYSSARSEFSGTASVWLDANESPYNAPYNRYPDPLQKALKARIAEVKGVAAENIFLGVGSDECIDMMYRVFCRPGVDNVVAISPSYGMYQVCAEVNDVEYRQAPLNADFSLNIDNLFAQVDAKTKVMWICSPNNPTGNAFSLNDIAYVADRFAGLVVVDEAYIDFSSVPSAITLGRENVVVMQTFSKAWGSAAVRLGMAFAAKEIIDVFNKVKYPYNISQLAQDYATGCLERRGEVATQVATLLANRRTLESDLAATPCVERVFASDANFVLVKVNGADKAYQYLLNNCGVVVRNRSSVALCGDCLRITVGTEAENKAVIEGLKEYSKTIS